MADWNAEEEARRLSSALDETPWEEEVDVLTQALTHAHAAGKREGAEGMRDKACRVMERSRRHVELSPGVGEKAQRYALGCINEDLESISALPLEDGDE